MERYSDRMISLAADALIAMRDLQNVKTGQMSVAASQTTGVYLMPPLIGESPGQLFSLWPPALAAAKGSEKGGRRGGGG